VVGYSVFVRWSYSISFRIASVAIFALFRHGSGSLDLSSLSSAFTGTDDVRRMLGEIIVSDRWMRLLTLFRMYMSLFLPVCLLALLQVRFPRLASLFVLNALHDVHSSTSGTVNVCSRGYFRLRYGDSPILGVISSPPTKSHTASYGISIGMACFGVYSEVK